MSNTGFTFALKNIKKRQLFLKDHAQTVNDLN